jgi:hypothetical protein
MKVAGRAIGFAKILKLFRKHERKRRQKASIAVCHLLYSGFLFGIFFGPENGGDMLL